MLPYSPKDHGTLLETLGESMKNLKPLVTCTALSFILAGATFAGGVSTPSCVPGEISTPPCAAAQMGTPSDVGTPALPSDEVSLTEIASSVLLSMLSLF